MSSPAISVIMPVYNGERYVAKAVGSIFAQTRKDWELIVVDDGCTDETVPIVRSFHDPRIRLVHHSKNKGLPQSRNTGIRAANGALIAFLDSDDVAHHTRLALQKSYLDSYEDISFVGSWVRVIDEQGTVLGGIWKHATASEIIPSILLFRNCFTQSSVMIRRACFDRFSFRDTYGPSPDFDLWTRLSEVYRCANLPTALTFYRLSGTAMSVRDEAVITAGVKKIHAWSISRLGLKPSDEDISLHDGLERWKKSYSAESLNRVHAWLLRLWLANETVRKYPEDIFAEVISDYWLKTCCLSIGSVAGIRNIYFQSELGTLRQSNWKKKNLVRMLSYLGRHRLIDVTSDDWIKIFH